MAGVSGRALRFWVWPAAVAVALAACGGTETPPREPELVADPPLDQEGSIAKGAAQSDLQRAAEYIKRERWADAKAALDRALATSPGNPEAHFYMGIVHEKENDLAGAEASYKAALAANPTFAEAVQNLAAIYLSASPPRADDAIPILRKALEKTPDDTALLQNLGYALGLKGDVPGASKAYDTAIAKKDSVELRFAYATLLAENKQADKAVPHLKKVLEGTKDDAPMLATIGRMFAYGKAFGDCIAAFDRALKLKADDPEWYLRRGTCRHEVGDEPGALSDYQAAIKKKPDFAPAHYYAGLSLLDSHKPQSAQLAMEQAVKYGGDTPLGKAAREKLKLLRAINKK
jgi:tetratricopeptide (TPR) repeat protein